jgi:glycosyltransferase involved in cell wall biosynthesis
MKQSRKKIMFMNYSLDIGGAEIMILELVKGLNKRYFDVSICSMSDKNVLKPEFEKIDIPVFICPKKTGFDWKSIPKILAILKDNKIDLLHTHDFPTWLYGGLASLLAPGCRLVHTQHSNIESKRKIPSSFKRVLSLLTKEIIAVNDQVGDFLYKDGYSPKSKLHILYSGINIPGEEIIKQKIESNDIRFVITARLAKAKNHEYLIKSFAKLCKKHDKATLSIIGDGLLRKSLNDLVSQLEMEEKIYFLGQVLNAKTKLVDYDVFVLTSISEGLSFSLLEAMAYRLPIIATDVGGNGMLVDHGENGLLVESNNEQQLVEAMETLLLDREKRERMGQKSQQKVKSKFSHERMLKEYEAIYVKALNIHRFKDSRNA